MYPNQQLLDYHIAILRYPDLTTPPGKKLFDQVMNSRLTRLEKAKSVAPFWLPVTIKLDGILNKIDVAYTPPINYPLLVIGAIANTPGPTPDTYNVSIQIRDVVSHNDWTQDFVLPAVLAGADPTGLGMDGIFYFPAPFLLSPNNQLILSYQNIGGVTETDTLVFICLRVAPVSLVPPTYDASEMPAVTNIQNHVVPRTYVLRLQVPFTSTVGEILTNVRTTQTSDPLLILGAATNLYNSLVQLSDANQNLWSSAPIPVWALASHVQTRKSPYVMFPKPYYLRPNSQLRGDFTNGIKAVADAAGEIDFLCMTP